MHNDLRISHFLNVFRVDRYLAAAAWGIDDELWNCIASGMTTQGANDLNPLAGIGSEVSTASYQVALIQIVGPHTHH